MTEKENTLDQVGPVLQAGTAAEAVIAAIKNLNESVTVIDRGAYLRVFVPRRCIVTKDAIEKQLGHSFELPGDLELLMPSFKGLFSVSEDQALWELESLGGRL